MYFSYRILPQQLSSRHSMLSMHSTFGYKRKFIQDNFMTSNNTHSFIPIYIKIHLFFNSTSYTPHIFLLWKTTSFSFYKQFIIFNKQSNIFSWYITKKGWKINYHQYLHQTRPSTLDGRVWWSTPQFKIWLF